MDFDAKAAIAAGDEADVLPFMMNTGRFAQHRRIGMNKPFFNQIIYPLGTSSFLVSRKSQ